MIEFDSPEELREELTYLENFELEYNGQANEILNINTVVYIFIHAFLTGLKVFTFYNFLS